MASDVALIGFGEAACAFADGWAAMGIAAIGFDQKVHHAPSATGKHADYAAHRVRAALSEAEALAGAPVVLSLVTADQALAAAQAGAPHLSPGALWCDMNSVAPDTKRAAAAAIERAGGRYLDVAVMAPVHPQRRAVPLLVAGPHAEAGMAALAALGFGSIRPVGGAVGSAAAVKMIRSVIVKGIEALTAECLLAADAAGVTADVLRSLGDDWPARADYNIDRMMVHGTRRAAEMAESRRTLEMLGTGAAMTAATAARQAELGAFGLSPPPAGLDAKLAALRAARLSPAKAAA